MEPTQLWALSDEDFNSWRRENDLKNLFDSFQRCLPHFDEWLKTYNFSIDFILKTDKPGGFFYGEKETILVEDNNEIANRYFFVEIQDEKHDKDLKKIPKTENVTDYRFIPYLQWAKLKTGDNSFLKSKYSDHGTFRVVTRTAPDSPELSNAIMVPGISLLKLGGVKIEMGLSPFRNLDFTDLDFLEIEGSEFWSRENSYYFASCRNLKFIDTDISFKNFYGCWFEKLDVLNSKFQGVRFFGCDIFGANFENTKLFNIVIEECSSNSFSFNRVEVDGLEYVPPSKEWHSGVALTYQTIIDNYKRLRVLYQNNGHRREAGEAYYNERLYELKYLSKSLQIKWVFRIFKSKGFKYARPYLIEEYRKLSTVITGTISRYIWGFGERPLRTIIASLVIIFFFAIIYLSSGIPALGGNIVESVYLSIIMFSTLGFGDYSLVQDSSLKIIMAFEALLGAFTYGLFIAGYANKSRY